MDQKDDGTLFVDMTIRHELAVRKRHRPLLATSERLIGDVFQQFAVRFSQCPSVLRIPVRSAGP